MRQTIQKNVPLVSVLFPFWVFLTHIHLLLKSNQMNLGTPLGASTAETSGQGAEVTVEASTFLQVTPPRGWEGKPGAFLLGTLFL